MIYFVAFEEIKDNRSSWSIKVGKADGYSNVRNRLNYYNGLRGTTRSVYLMGLMPGSVQWEASILGQFSYLGNNGVCKMGESLRVDVNLLRFIYENSGIEEYKDLIPLKMQRFDWKQFEVKPIIYLPATSDLLRVS